MNGDEDYFQLSELNLVIFFLLGGGNLLYGLLLKYELQKEHEKQPRGKDNL